MMSPGELWKRGLLASHRPLASVAESFGMPGTPAPERLLIARLFDSVEFEVLPGRGFDIGATWFRGTPISWFSPVSDARALPAPTGREWLTRFTGGLLTTCGFRHIGEPTGNHGMHGSASHLAADEVAWRVGEDPSTPQLTLSGTVEDASLFEASFRMRRSITATSSGGDGTTLRVTDQVTNIGPRNAGLSMLYHLNLGAPLVVPGTTVHVDGAGATASDAHPEVPDWRILPEPVEHLAEAVFRHDSVRQDDGGWARAVVAEPGEGLTVTIEWSAETLPYLHQWVFPTRGRWALGIEPSTAPLFGPGRAEPDEGAPVLAPGEMRTHDVQISVRAPTRG